MVDGRLGRLILSRRFFRNDFSDRFSFRACLNYTDSTVFETH